MSANSSLILAGMPAEILLEVFERVPDLKSRFSITQVCKIWRELSLDNPSVWSFVNLSMPGALDEEEELGLLDECLERSEGHPLIFIANFIGMRQRGINPMHVGRLMDRIQGRAKTLGDFRTLVVSENDDGPSVTTFPLTQSYSMNFSAELAGGKRLPKVWVHTNWKGHDQVFSTNVDHTAACLGELGLSLQDLGIQDGENFISIHTSGSESLALNFVATASANWQKLTTLHMDVPGCSHQYLSILDQSINLKEVTLGFTSPPLSPTDFKDRKQVPTGYQGPRQVVLAHLTSLNLKFTNGSYYYLASERFLDALAPQRQLENMSFYSDSLKVHFPDRKARMPGFGPLYDFLSGYGKNLTSFSSDIGDGMDVMTLLRLIAVGGGLKTLQLLALCENDIQTPLVIQGDSGVLSLHSLCNLIRDRPGFGSLENLLLDYPLETIYDVLAIIDLVGNGGHPNIRSVDVKAANSDITVKKEYVLPGNTALLKRQDILDAHALAVGTTMRKKYALDFNIDRTEIDQISVVIMN